MLNLLTTISQIRQRYSKITPALKAGIWFVVCNVLQRGIQFITTPVYTRLLSTEEYGYYSLFTTWLNIFIVFATLNLSNGAYYNGILKYEKKRNEYTSAIQCLGNIATLLFAVIIYLTYPILDRFIGLPLNVCMLMILVFFFNPAYSFWMMQQRLDYKYRLLIVLTALSSTLTPVIGICLISILNCGYLGAVWGYVICNVGIGIAFFIINLYKGKCIYNKEYWIYSLTLSLPLIPHYLSQIVLGQSDRIMIKYYCGVSEAGIYSLAYQVSLIMNLLISGINNSLNPWILRSLKEHCYKDIKRVTMQIIIFIAILSGGAMMIAPELIMILGTREYMSAIWVIPPVILSTWITFCYCIWGTSLFYFERTMFVAISSSVGAILNLILNAIFIPIYGFIAAAYTTLIGYLVIAIFYWFFTRKVLNENDLKLTDVYDMRSMLFALMGLILVTAVVLISYQLDAIVRYTILSIICLIAISFRKKIIAVIKKVFPRNLM